MRKLIMVVVLWSLIPELALAEEDRYEEARKSEEKRLASEAVQAKRKALSKEDQEKIAKCEKLLEGDRFLSVHDWTFIRKYPELFSLYDLLKHSLRVGRGIKGVSDVMREFGVLQSEEDNFISKLVYGLSEEAAMDRFETLKRLAKDGPLMLLRENRCNLEPFEKWLLPWLKRKIK